MIATGMIVRIGCTNCGSFFDADLDAIRKVRGAGFSLIGRSGRCPITTCRGRTIFVAAPVLHVPLLPLVHGLEDPLALNGLTAEELEPPPPPDGGGAQQLATSLAHFVSHIATRPAVA